MGKALSPVMASKDAWRNLGEARCLLRMYGRGAQRICRGLWKHIWFLKSGGALACKITRCQNTPGDPLITYV